MCDTANAQNHRWLAKLHFNVIWLNHTIFSVSLMMDVKFQLIYLINESIRKSCGGWLFWGAFIALPLRPACVVWFVERLKWGWLVEQRLALDLHTLLNHTDSWLPALPTTPPQTQIYLRAGAPLDAEPCGSFNTQPSAESQFQPAIDNGGCCAATATKWFPARTAWEDIGPNFRRRGRIGDRNKKSGSEGSAGQVAIVVGWINLCDWKHKESLQSSRRTTDAFLACGKTIFCLNASAICFCERLDGQCRALRAENHKTLNFHIKP